MSGEEGLIARHDADSGIEGAQDMSASRFNAADEFNDDVHPVDRFGGVGCQQFRGDLSVARRIGGADENCTDVHPSSRSGGKFLALFGEESDHLGTNCSGTEDAKAQGGELFGHWALLLHIHEAGGEEIFAEKEPED